VTGAPVGDDAPALPRTSPGIAGTAARHVLPAVMWTLLGLYAAGLVMHGREEFSPLVDGWLGILTQVLPAAVAWCAVPGAGPRRAEVAVTAVALTVFLAGNCAFVLGEIQGREFDFPGPADYAFLTFYPILLVAVALAARRERPEASRTVWLDGALAGLGTAAVLVVVLEQVFDLAAQRPMAIGFALVYPFFDLLLLATVIGIVARQGRASSSSWLWLLAGLAALAVVDVSSALALAAETYQVGGTLDASWPLGLACVALWARSRPPPSPAPSGGAALVVPTMATLAGLGVLVAASRGGLSVLAVVLACLTQIAAAGRMHLAFHQLRRVSELRRQATTDDLTGLPNRRAFYERVTTALAEPDRVLALLLLDLDRFKEVNDSLGHHVGDKLLGEVGLRLRDELREGDVLARLGGDEFAVLLGDVSQEQAVAVAEKLRTALAEPCTLEGIALRTDVSIGLAIAPEHGTELSVLLRRADIAMYQAKRGREGLRVYSGVDDTAGRGRLRALQELPGALSEGQLTLHYQPKLDLATNEVHGVEALVRWDHPTKGLLYPDSFLMLVEDAGLMRTLTEIVLSEALDQAKSWLDRGRPLTVAVNLSATSLVDANLPEQVMSLIVQRRLPASALQLEITEEFLMADRDRARDILARLRELGVRIAVDDFGTGYSSLAYLRELPIDELKLDRSFVFPMADDARAAALVFSTIGLAHSLGLRMVAEGVENRTALEELARHGCDEAQGYYLSRPLPAAELDVWLERRSRAVAPAAPPQ
jgi:diguanylate cyclase (GGDEF)-like protein